VTDQEKDHTEFETKPFTLRPRPRSYCRSWNCHCCCLPLVDSDCAPGFSFAGIYMYV